MKNKYISPCVRTLRMEMESLLLDQATGSITQTPSGGTGSGPDMGGSSSGKDESGIPDYESKGNTFDFDAWD